MPAAETILHGITAFGEVTDPYGTPADVSWGHTEEDGFRFRINGQEYTVRTAMSVLAAATFTQNLDITFQTTLPYSDLLNVARGLGLADSAVTGDLQATPTPSDEVLEPVVSLIGAREFYLYCLSPGPVSTRRLELKRCKITPSLELQMGKGVHPRVQINGTVLAPTQSGHETKPFKITDAA